MQAISGAKHLHLILAFFPKRSWFVFVRHCLAAVDEHWTCNLHVRKSVPLCLCSVHATMTAKSAFPNNITLNIAGTTLSGTQIKSELCSLLFSCCPFVTGCEPRGSVRSRGIRGRHLNNDFLSAVRVPPFDPAELIRDNSA